MSSKLTPNINFSDDELRQWSATTEGWPYLENIIRIYTGHPEYHHIDMSVLVNFVILNYLKSQSVEKQTSVKEYLRKLREEPDFFGDELEGFLAAPRDNAGGSRKSKKSKKRNKFSKKSKRFKKTRKSYNS